jgi:serine protease
MIRTIAAAAIILVSTALSAGDAQRYLIATKRPLGNGALAGIVKDARAGNVRAFRTFTGFAATLTAAQVTALRESTDIRWIEPVIERHAAATERNRNGQTIPYGIDAVHAREAWAGRMVGNVNVAVLDTGIDFRHDELSAIYKGGYNVWSRDTTPPMDDGGHGTHVAGTVAAADNTSGVVGIAPHVRLWGVKVLNSAGSGSNETIIEGIDWVVAKKKELGGNWIINLSLGSPKPSIAESESVAKAVDAGVLIVAAAGNESTPTAKGAVIYPAAYPGVVAVGAVDDTETVASFSNQGPQLDFVAPGVAILSTVPLGSNFVSSVASANRTYTSAALEAAANGTVTAEFVNCGLGHPHQFPPSVRGRIAVIKRGELTFAAKARNAVEAGARAVVIYNNNSLPINWTLQSDTDLWSYEYQFPIVVSMTKTDGESLVQQSGEITVKIDPDDYAVYSGTSMAAPHVAGAAALLWSMAPHAKAADIVNALTTTAVDRGVGGFDPAYGAGVIDIFAAAKQLAPYAFVPGGTTTGRPPGKRGRG